MEEKKFKTIDEQLEILKSRGLIIEDESIAKEFLLYNNYYRVSGYSLTLRKNDIFYESTTFQNIIDIYNFDHEFRHIILKYIEKIEVKFKSIYAYEFAKLYGSTGYLDKSNFTNEEKHQKIITKSNDLRNKLINDEKYLQYFINRDMPLWAYVDLFTIADISILYSISLNEIKKNVINNFTSYKSSQTIEKHIHSMTIIRNLCAHGMRIYNRIFHQKPSLNKEEKKLLIQKNNKIIDNKFYGFIIIMKKLLSKFDFQSMKNSIIELTEKYPFVKMTYYGFRDDWKEIL